MILNKDREAINKLILDLHAKETIGKDIATALNKAGFKTAHGKNWSAPLVSNYSLANKLRGRKVSTSAGAAGSTGSSYAKRSKRAKRAYSKFNGQSTAAPVARSKKSISDTEIEEVMTSNLDTSLKLKIIRIVAIGNLHA